MDVLNGRIRSGFVDQASRLRRWMASPDVGGQCHSIAITSGKGGVGKSNVAVNLAVMLAGRGLRVTLVDTDLGMANDDLLLGLHCPHNLSHVMAGVRSIDEVSQDAPGGFRFVPGLSGDERLADLSDFERRRLLDHMALLERDGDVLLLDCGAGISRNVLTFGLAADAVLVVTTPEPTAIADAYATVKALWREQYEGVVHLLVNMTESRAEARAVHGRLFGVAQKFLKYPIADGGYLLHDRHVELAVRQRYPFVLRYPRCPASACMGAVAVRLAKVKGRPDVGGGYFRRVVGLFV
jgi:flagellar biosynthesis protein FlhG